MSAFRSIEQELRAALREATVNSSEVKTSAVTTFNWNNDGRVTVMDLPGTTNDPAYAYNGLGTRVRRTVGASTVGWKRSGAGVTASVLNDGTATFTPGISSRVGTTSTFTHAGLKNTTAQSETTSLSATRTYDAFGLDVSSTGTWKTAFGYAGAFGYQDTDAGMKLLGHRYYDPETGRFLSRDPIKDGRNWYAYGAGETNMVRSADPTGLQVPENWRHLLQKLQNALRDGSSTLDEEKVQRYRNDPEFRGRVHKRIGKGQNRGGRGGKRNDPTNEELEDAIDDQWHADIAADLIKPTPVSLGGSSLIDYGSPFGRPKPYPIVPLWAPGGNTGCPIDDLIGFGLETAISPRRIGGGATGRLGSWLGRGSRGGLRMGF